MRDTISWNIEDIIIMQKMKPTQKEISHTITCVKLAIESLKKYFSDNKIERVKEIIIVPDKIINFVTE